MSTTSTSKSLSGGAIAGIVIGSLAGTILLGVLVYFIFKNRLRIADMFRARSTTTNDRSAQQPSKRPPVPITPAQNGVYLIPDIPPVPPQPNQPFTNISTAQITRQF